MSQLSALLKFVVLYMSVPIVIMILMMIHRLLNSCSTLCPICMVQIMKGIAGNDNISVAFGVFHNLFCKSCI